MEASLVGVEDQFMLGNGLLFKAITGAKVESTTVTLPKSAIWYDFHTFDRVLSEQVTVPITLESIPIFARGGSIIPLRTRLRRSASLMQKDPFTLVAFLDEKEEANGRLYIDDGTTFEYQNGTYQEIKMSFSKRTLSVECIKGNDKDSTSAIERIIIVGLTQGPESVIAHPTNQKLNYTFDESILIIKSPPSLPLSLHL